MQNLVEKSKKGICKRQNTVLQFKGTSKNSKVLFKEQDIIEYVKNYYKKGE